MLQNKSQKQFLKIWPKEKNKFRPISSNSSLDTSGCSSNGGSKENLLKSKYLLVPDRRRTQSESFSDDSRSENSPNLRRRVQSQENVNLDEENFDQILVKIEENVEKLKTSDNSLKTNEEDFHLFEIDLSHNNSDRVLARNLNVPSIVIGDVDDFASSTVNLVDNGHDLAESGSVGELPVINVACRKCRRPKSGWKCWDLIQGRP